VQPGTPEPTEASEAGDGPETPVAHSISNSQVFTAEDYVGNVLTNFQNNSLVGVNFQFDDSADPKKNRKDYSDPYQLRTRVMRRALD
jgi:hypothetical protein